MGLKWKTSGSSDKIAVPVNDRGGRDPVCSGEQDAMWQFRSLFNLKKVKPIFYFRRYFSGSKISFYLK